jgi:putative transposase
LALIERQNAALPLTVQADLLSVSRASLYYQPAAPSAEEVALKHRIDEIYTAHPFYGSRRIAAQMQREGLPICRNTVASYMQEMGIAAVSPGPNLSRRESQHRVYPYLLRGLTIAQPNEVWGVDITYVRLRRGWMYLVAVLDWYSRYVVSWELDQTLEMPFVLAAVDRALEGATPKIWNSDQGSHFTSPHYTERLLAKGVRISMDGKGRALDNIFTERLWRSVKYEEVYLHEYDSPREARHGLTRYLSFYNEERLHQALGYKPPAEVYFNYPIPRKDSGLPNGNAKEGITLPGG